MASPKNGSQAVNAEISNQKQGRSGSNGMDFHRKFNGNRVQSGGINRSLKKPNMTRSGSAKNKNT